MQPPTNQPIDIQSFVVSYRNIWSIRVDWLIDWLTKGANAGIQVNQAGLPSINQTTNDSIIQSINQPSEKTSEHSIIHHPSINQSIHWSSNHYFSDMQTVDQVCHRHIGCNRYTNSFISRSINRLIIRIYLYSRVWCTCWANQLINQSTGSGIMRSDIVSPHRSSCLWPSNTNGAINQSTFSHRKSLIKSINQSTINSKHINQRKALSHAMNPWINQSINQQIDSQSSVNRWLVDWLTGRPKVPMLVTDESGRILINQTIQWFHQSANRSINRASKRVSIRSAAL